MTPGVCVLGAAPDTTNLGVSALLESIVNGLHTHAGQESITVFDNGLGVREDSVHLDSERIVYERLGIRSGFRFYRSESMINMKVATKLGFWPNIALGRMRSAAAVLDISGGDSFADIYGQKRFRAIRHQKELALAAGRPLVLLPQTFGPYQAGRNRSAAADILRQSHSVWARDAVSFDVLKELLGDDYNSEVHRLGVDVAFALPARPPERLDTATRALLADESTTLFGLNVSGLLANDQRHAGKFGLAQDYASLVRRLLTRLLEETDASVLLVPHVVGPTGPESDLAAAERLRTEVPAGSRDRVSVLRGIGEAQAAKWVIAQCDAFCGTRMHSTIAALSTNTPAVALAYSAKTKGVFDTCGQGARVVDLRFDGSPEVEDAVLRLWADRRQVESELLAVMPSIRAQAVEPFAQLATLIQVGG